MTSNTKNDLKISRLMLDRISDKWSLTILNCLSKEAIRFNQLKREVGGISQKVLSETLKKVERDGLIKRTVYVTSPITVEYELTELGYSFIDATADLLAWVNSNAEDIQKAQSSYDKNQQQNSQKII